MMDVFTIVVLSCTELKLSWQCATVFYSTLAGPVQIAQLCHLYSVENLLEHNT